MNLFSSQMATAMLLDTLVWPLLAMATVFGVRRLAPRQDMTRRAFDTWGELAVAAGFVAASVSIQRLFPLPPVQAVDWLPVFAASGWAVFFAAGTWDSTVRIASRGLVVLAATGILLAPLLAQAGPVRGLAMLLSVAALWFGTWCYVIRNRWATATGGVPLLATAAGHAVVATLGGSLLLGQLSGALAASLGGWLVLDRFVSKRRTVRIPDEIAALILGSLMLIGYQYSETPLSALLFLVAALAADMPLRALRRRGMLSVVPTPVLAAIAALPPVVLAIWLASDALRSAASPY